MRPAPRWRTRLTIVAGVLLLLDLAATLALAFYWRNFATASGAGNFVAVAVLHADTPPSLARTRRALDLAVEMHREGRTRYILCIGGNRPADKLHAGDAMRAHLVASGVPAALVLSERESYDTRTNIIALGKVLEQLPAGRVAVIAYPVHQLRVNYHMRRQAPGVNAVLIAPRAPMGFVRVAYESWVGLHHEILSWGLTLVLGNRQFAALMRRLRSMEPASGVR